MPALECYSVQNSSNKNSEIIISKCNLPNLRRSIRIETFSSWPISMPSPFFRYWSILDPLALLPMQGMAFKVKSGPLKETALLILGFLSLSTSSCRTAGLGGLQTQVKYNVRVPRTRLTSICGGLPFHSRNQMLQEQAVQLSSLTPWPSSLARNKST